MAFSPASLSVRSFELMRAVRRGASSWMERAWASTVLPRVATCKWERAGMAWTWARWRSKQSVHWETVSGAAASSAHGERQRPGRQLARSAARCSPMNAPTLPARCSLGGDSPRSCMAELGVDQLALFRPALSFSQQQQQRSAHLERRSARMLAGSRVIASAMLGRLPGAVRNAVAGMLHCAAAAFTSVQGQQQQSMDGVQRSAAAAASLTLSSPLWSRPCVCVCVYVCVAICSSL
jgi:hypothetical protein